MATWSDLSAENRTAAFELFERRRWRAVANRAYFAVYAEVTQHLLGVGVTMPAGRGNPSHRALQGLIEVHFYTTSLPNRTRLSGLAYRLYELRIIADYAPHLILEEAAARSALAMMSQAFRLF